MNAIILTGMLSLSFIPIIPQKIVYESNEPKITINTYDVELEAWIEKLAKCESGNNEKAIHKNDGGSDSMGYLQYKEDTFRRYIEKFSLRYTEEDIWNREAQIEVTKQVIKQDYAWKNWYNCTKKIGLPPVYQK